jgi:ubiquinone/menaquinone biosynthesis C-methylase UbiE
MFKYLIIGLIAIIVVSLKAQNMSVFIAANKSEWYPKFLEPVVASVASNGSNLQILDIGTGPGKLPELLVRKDSSFRIVGTDISRSYIEEAKRRVQHKNVSFQLVSGDERLSFDDSSFDIVTLCSVLFLLDDSAKSSLMMEVLRVLKPGGKIIVLTPSGEKIGLSAFSEVWAFPYSRHNWTYPVWKNLTLRSGRKWRKEKWLSNFSINHSLFHCSEFVFNNNATIETITKPIN